MSRRIQLINEIKQALDTRPKLYKAFFQDRKQKHLFHEGYPDVYDKKKGKLMTKKECLDLPARGHLFIVHASLCDK